MFHDIPEPVQARVAALKERGARDRADADERVTAVVVAFPTGQLLLRKRT